MLTIDALNSFGANTKEGLGRCMNNEAFYLRLTRTAAGDPGFEKLKSALDAGDMKAAFEAAHGLKGILGNLSLTPMFDLASAMTEDLRTQREKDYGPELEKLLALRDELLVLCSD